MLSALAEFASASGLHINQDKSSLLCASMDDQGMNLLKSITGFQMGRLPFRYLGIPLHAARLTAMHYSPLLDKISGYINGWLSKTLSYAGKIELIKSVIQGIDCFWLSLLPIPIFVLDRIISLCRKFLFGNFANFPPVAWESICAPKYEGGLGLLCLRTWNVALLSSHLWDFHKKKDTLWVKWVSHFYMGGESVWVRRPKRDISPLMKKIGGIRDEIVKSAGSANPSHLLDAWQINGKFHTSRAYDFFDKREIGCGGVGLYGPL
ncbi:hypothetical protein Dimus_038974 [Dionaea muscipula]